MIGDSIKYILGALFLVLVVLFETSVLPFFPILGAQSNLLLVILLALQFLGSPKESYYGAFFGGILLDLLNSTTFGFSSLFLLLLTGAVGLARRAAASPLLILLLITFIASLFFRVARVFPTFSPAIFLKGGLVDVGVMVVVYPTLRYVLKGLFARREIQVGV